MRQCTHKADREFLTKAMYPENISQFPRRGGSQRSPHSYKEQSRLLLQAPEVETLNRVQKYSFSKASH